MSGEEKLSVGIFFDFNCFFPTNPDSIVDITQSFIQAWLYNNEIESPTFIIKFFHAYNCLSFSTDFPLYNPISKKKDSKNFVSHSINICLSKNKGFKASNFSLSAIKSCEISRVKI